jgi:mono/diheme cytochrome c family protein
MRLIAAILMLAASVTTAAAVEMGDPDLGFDYAREACAECHAIHADDFESPILEVPGFEEIANIPAMSHLALVSFFQTSHEFMPNFMVPPEEVDDLIAYILSLRD